MTRTSFVLAFLTALSLLVPAAVANEVVFTIAPHSPDGVQNTQLSFTLNPDDDLITVGLVNLQMDPHNVAQLISGVGFVVRNQDGGRLSGTLGSATANGVTIDPNTGAPQLTAITSINWVVDPTASNSLPAGSIFLCRICPGGNPGGGADQLIVGGPDQDGRYDVGGTGSLLNDAHNPFLWGNGGVNIPTFEIHVGGLLSGATVSNVMVMFGTTFGAVKVGPFTPDSPPPAVPEPGAAALLLGGLMAVTVRRFCIRDRCGARS